MSSGALAMVRLTTAIGEQRSIIADLLPAHRFTRSVQAALTRSPDLRACDPESLVQAVIDAAALGVMVDGATGQGFLVPTKKGKAKLIVGSKGVVALAARLGLAVQSGAVRQGDHFAYALGSQAFIDHRPDLAGAARRPVIAAWAMATSKERGRCESGGPPLVSVLPRAAILETRERAPSMKRLDSAWRELDGPAFAAMAAKSAVRQLLKLLPLGEHEAAAASRLEAPIAGDAGDDDRSGDDAREIDVEARMRPAGDVAPTFPVFDRLAPFVRWSAEFLAGSSAAGAEAWRATYADRLEAAGRSDRPDVLVALAELQAAYSRAIDTRPPEAPP